jgi:glucosamine--fructose-6-phosphate aminotransferase (isomerizing)
MCKEIFQQPQIIKALSDRFFDSDLNIKEVDIPIKKFEKIYICASGTSKNAADIAKYFIEKLTGITTIVEFASEFAHKPACISDTDFFIAISQSGNTADTFEALKKAKEKGAMTFAITNNTESKIHKFADYKIFTDAGEEKSIAATKSFSAQLFILYVVTVFMAEKLGFEDNFVYKKELSELYLKYDQIFAQIKKIKKIVSKIKKTKSMVILARGINYAVSAEGSLKIKETAYIDANGFPSGEFLHGHFAFVDKNIPVISLINKCPENLENYELSLKNTKEIKEKRNPVLIVLKTVDDNKIKETFEKASFIDIPIVSEELTPFLNTACLQLFAFEIAVSLGKDVDKPRSLKKCVEKE